MKKIKGSATPQKGAVTVLVALTLPVLLGVGALAVDLAYLHVVRNELQNDADAAAMAGARKLYLKGASTLDWASAATTAKDAIVLNRAANHALADGDVLTGYWDTTQATTGLQTSLNKPGATYAPAVQVSLGKSGVENEGPVRTFLASIWGIYAKPVRVTAVAGVHSPARADLAFPLAISECMYQKYWDFNSQPPKPIWMPGTQQPYKFLILGDKSFGQCAEGRWTPLNFLATGANDIVKIIEHHDDFFNALPPMLSLGEKLPVINGNMSRVYDAVEKCIGGQPTPCNLVVVPVVDQLNEPSTIKGFACMQLLGVKGKSEKFIEVQMSNECPSLPSGGIGPNYGVISPPSLFK